MTEKPVHEWNDAGCVIHGDCLEVLRTLEDNSVDAIITDPPAGISFMGKSWDNFSGKNKHSDSDIKRAEANANTEKLKQYNQGSTPYAFSHGTGKTTPAERDAFIAFMTEVMQEALRVLKPGGHALVWSLPRTSHWTAIALEDAGFEIRDNIYHIFGSGFPKSLNVSAAIDKHLHAERQVVGVKTYPWKGLKSDVFGEDSRTVNEKGYQQSVITAPATPAAQQYAGFGTALKPSVETWWLCRKPLAAKSVADNVLQYGTGAINIDACRVACTDKTPFPAGVVSNSEQVYGNGKGRYDNRPRPIDANPSGRWPSHLLLSHTLLCGDECADDCPVRALDSQSGIKKNGAVYNKAGIPFSDGSVFPKNARSKSSTYEPSEGGASRYFQQFYYSAKTSRAERNAGCANLPPAQTFDKNKSAVIHRRNPETGDTSYSEYTPSSNQNTHPTVKPQALMRYLVRLITPPDGVVLDCFGGSGSTALACIAENKRFILIEQDASYVEIAKARIVYALEQEQKCSA